MARLARIAAEITVKQEPEEESQQISQKQDAEETLNEAFMLENDLID